MLLLTLPKEEVWVEASEEFVEYPEIKLKLEHSLISISKWESKHKKPYLSTELTPAEFLDYVYCMSLDPNLDSKQLVRLIKHPTLLKQISDYQSDPMTATTFNRENIKKMHNRSSSGEFTTAETIYYWMVSLNIPFSCEKWHINRLMALIEMCNVKQAPAKQMSQSDILKQQASLNKARRAKKPNIKH